MKESKIQQMVSEFFSNEWNSLCMGGTLYVRDFKLMLSVLDGTIDGDFLIYDNLGGRPFDILVNSEQYPKTVQIILAHMKKERPYAIFAYRIKGKETILRQLNKQS